MQLGKGTRQPIQLGMYVQLVAEIGTSQHGWIAFQIFGKTIYFRVQLMDALIIFVIKQFYEIFYTTFMKNIKKKTVKILVTFFLFS